jgi:hypothetical protein
MAGEAVFVFDDVNWSDGMRNAWSTIVDDPRIALTVDLRSVGIAVASPRRDDIAWTCRINNAAKSIGCSQ